MNDKNGILSPREPLSKISEALGDRDEVEDGRNP
jgi:hypothetical protein